MPETKEPQSQKAKKIQEKDFITVEYTAKLEDGTVFDTTNEQIAKDAGIHSENTAYGDVTICVGKGHLLAGLDKALVGATIGEHTIMLPPENAFGKKSAKLIQLVSTNKFKKQGIQPYPGLQVNIDGSIGTIKNISGGRTLVDFNHPLSGHPITYDVTIKRIVTDPAKQLDAVVKLTLGSSADSGLAEGVAKVKTKNPVPEQIQAEVKSQVIDCIPSIKDVQFDTTGK